MSDASRLGHLGRLLSDLAASLEMKLASEKRELGLLCRQREELAESLGDGSQSWTLFYSHKLKSLLSFDAQIAARRQRLDALQSRVRQSRRQGERAMERAATSQSETDRREEEREALEVALSMGRRAPDKDGMMK